jgi:hypothetical protein
MTYGNLYYGKEGFFYKRSSVGGVRRVLSIGSICNQPQNIFNKYVNGSGVGASSVFARRAKINRAAFCNSTGRCVIGKNIPSPIQPSLYMYGDPGADGLNNSQWGK